MGVIVNKFLVFFLALSLLLLKSACHPFSMFAPKAIKPKEEIEETNHAVSVAIDSHGIPFITGNTLPDIVYGLGFMHARDRLFQLDLLRHAAQGRLSELFGEKTLAMDKKLRLLTYRLDEQINFLNQREHQLLNSYIQGINSGAKKRGRSAEHFLLGIQFEDFTIKDIIAIARLQTWTLGSDLLAEITRLKIARSDWPAEAKNEIFTSLNDRNSSIIRNESKSAILKNLTWPTYLSQKTYLPQHQRPRAPELVQSGGGASNAWAVEARLSTDGHAVLMNDPHLSHTWPSNFYLATLKADGFFATGATFVGLPGILIGASQNVSWGVTASYLNTQDSVLLSFNKEQKNTYVVDGQNHVLEEWPQKYCLNKSQKCIDGMHYKSIFGPIVSHEFEPWIHQDDILAIQWTGFRIEEHFGITQGFFDLAQAKNVTEAIKSIQSMTLPGVNMVLADTLGNIAYTYAGMVPKRDENQHPYLPLDGSLSWSRWNGFLDKKDEPQTINPSAGYIITANQNIYGSDAGWNFHYGQQGAPPYRAIRIKERIDNALRQKPTLDFDELSSIQLDETSKEAQELAPLLGNMCEDWFSSKGNNHKFFAQAIKSFDGRYTTESRGALPYNFLVDQITSNILAEVLDKEIPHVVSYFGQIGYNIKDALLKELTGQPTAIFKAIKARSGGFREFVGTSCEQSFTKMTEEIGTSPWKWRYGRHHYLKRQSILAKAPIVGGFFKDKKREVAGAPHAPMAESGTPVTYGANLRFRAKMSSPPQIYAVIDSGNSGTVGDTHAFDQAELWHQGKAIQLESDWQKAWENSSLRFTIGE